MKTIKRKELNEIQLTLLTASTGTLRHCTERDGYSIKRKHFRNANESRNALIILHSYNFTWSLQMTVPHASDFPCAHARSLLQFS